VIVGLYVVVYAAVLVALAGCIARAVQYARTPLHLRWELYPVPHEASERVEHGGSYFEESDWWQKPSHFNLWGELKFMIPEMVFLKGLWEFNRKLWFRSFPFHFGLYLLIGTVVLVAFGEALAPVYVATGAAGAALAILGALALLVRRLTDSRLRIYTAPADYFNLVFFVVALSALGAGCLAKPAELTLPALLRGMATFDTTLRIPVLLEAGILLCALLAAYIPLTHMSHFIAKWFTYHHVRWDDKANYKAEAMQKKIAEYLSYRPGWAAAHMLTGKTWAEIATANPWEGAKK
jgi:nitrate reductase gamma subunit